jgi:hypothetical protein
VAGAILSRELNRAALEKAQLEISKKQIEDLVERARVETQLVEAARLLAVAKEMDASLQKQEQALAETDRTLRSQVEAIERARNWKELADA